MTWSLSRSTPLAPERVAAAIPAGVVKVAESGIRGADDARRLADAGYDAILVGEHLVTSGDPARAVRTLVALLTRSSRDA